MHNDLCVRHRRCRGHRATDCVREQTAIPVRVRTADALRTRVLPKELQVCAILELDSRGARRFGGPGKVQGA